MATNTSTTNRLLKCSLAILWTLAAVTLFHWGRSALARALYQKESQTALHEALASGRPRIPTPHEWLGRLAIPRLQLSVMVLEGAEESDLALGVGHIPGTARPGQSGNAGLAGHRDTFFRALRGIRPGDEILWTSLENSSRYVVEFTEVVDAAEIRVLNSTEETTLTLVTCYPFYYIGPAPERFVVRAHLAGNRPDPGE
jgi:sortase A